MGRRDHHLHATRRPGRRYTLTTAAHEHQIEVRPSTVPVAMAATARFAIPNQRTNR
jgi:hypothetical protein